MSTPPTTGATTAPPKSPEPTSETSAPIATTAETEATTPAPLVTSAPLATTGDIGAPLEADDGSDADSTFGGSDASTTVSLTDSIRVYRELHGRTFHAYGATEYWGPNDETQNEQLDIGHQMFNVLFGNKLFLAPISSSPQKVLDVGTGTGIWAIDFADAYPSAKVIGTDLSPIQPSWVPPNLIFEIDDAQLDWTFADNDFDFLHMRALMGSIADWPKLYKNAFRCTKPGGYIEHVEYDITMTSDDGTVAPGHIMYDWPQTFIGAGEVMGRTFKVNSKKLMEDAGFVDIVEKVWKVPSSGWPKDPQMKELGRWQLLYLMTGLEGMALYILTTVLKWEYTEIQAYVGQMKAALVDTKNHGYNTISCVYGRKPEAGEVA